MEYKSVLRRRALTCDVPPGGADARAVTLTRSAVTFFMLVERRAFAWVVQEGVGRVVFVRLVGGN